MKSLLFVLSVHLIFIPSLEAGEAPKPFQQIAEVVDGWTPEQHLWIKGNLNLSAAKTAELEKWLDEKAKNWNVVLMVNAQGQGYEQHRGMRAVEYALGQGLPNRTGFSDLVDERTGQANGAIFVLFLTERKFSYFASDAFDDRGLGERNWVGRLDQSAVRAMRSGGRIVDAVKDTITNIESSLTRSIREEENQKRLAEIAKQKAIDEAKGYPKQLEAEIVGVETKVGTLRSQNPELIGPVVHPDISSWKATVETIRRLADQGDTKNARQHFTRAMEGIREFLIGLREWEKAPETLAVLEQQISKHPQPKEAPEVVGHLARAQEALDSATENHRIGEPLYSDQIRESERALSDAHLSYRAWVKAERERKQIKNGILILFAVAFLIFLIVMNRFRRPAKNEAETLLTRWEKELQGKFDALFSLMDRAGVVIGSRSDLREQGLRGTTEEVALSAIRSVDELFIMSAATDQVINQVTGLIQPASLLSRLLNRFSSRRYKAALRLLESEPIGFDQKDHLEAILSPPAEDSSVTRSSSPLLLGETSDYEPFRISFEKLISEYDERQNIAEASITRLENGIDGLPISLSHLWENLEKTRVLTDRLALAAGEDSLFPLVSLRQDLLPASQSSLEKLGRLGQKDPLLAFEEELPESTQLVTDGKMLAEAVEAFRAIDLPVIWTEREKLMERQRKTGWIGESLRDCTARSETLSRRAIQEDIAEVGAEFDDNLTRLKGRAISSARLAQQIEEVTRPRLAETRELVQKTRDELGSELGLEADSLLVEEELSPDEQIQRAAQGIDAALSALDHGRAENAEADLADIEICLDDASLLVEMSRRCVAQHAETIAALDTNRINLLEKVSPTQDLLTELENDYAPTVLLFSSRFGEEVEGQQSIARCIERSQRRLAQGEKDIAESNEAFSTGALIRALGLLEAIANELGFARHQLELVNDQYEALQESEKTNEASRERVITWIGDLEITSSDRRTQPDTLKNLELARVEVDKFVEDLVIEKSDPFRLSHEVAKLKAELRSLEEGIKADWESHELADSAATGAKAAISFCNSYLKEAHQDGIPDSRALTRAIQRHEELSQELIKWNLQLAKPHLDWGHIFEAVNEITAEAAKVRATLETELAAARDAAAQLKAAAGSLRSLQKWRSSHAVQVNRRAGNVHLLSSKKALAMGDYQSARTSAVRASGEALREMKRAQSREVQAIAAAAAAQRASMLSSSSSSLFSNGVGSSFSSSSSSGFSSSSFSSGSGFSSSGW